MIAAAAFALFCVGLLCLAAMAWFAVIVVQEVRRMIG